MKSFLAASALIFLALFVGFRGLSDRRPNLELVNSKFGSKQPAKSSGLKEREELGFDEKLLINEYGRLEKMSTREVIYFRDRIKIFCKYRQSEGDFNSVFWENIDREARLQFFRAQRQAFEREQLMSL